MEMPTLTREGIRYRVKLGHWFPRYFMLHEAIAWNRVIYCRSERMSAAMHCHEFKHLVQQRDDGLWHFTFRYLLDAIRYGYRGIPYEREAYGTEGDSALVRTFEALPCP
jgi:hypothetical protein